jgi:hypothetical protein
MYTTGMEPATRIAFRSLGAEDGSLGFENGSGGVIFSGYQVQGIFNSRFFLLNDLGNFRIIVWQIVH